jgi:hypothetical protein
MKRNWTHDELVETFTLQRAEQALLEHKTPLSCSPGSSQVAMLGSSCFAWVAFQVRLNSDGI